LLRISPEFIKVRNKTLFLKDVSFWDAIKLFNRLLGSNLLQYNHGQSWIQFMSNLFCILFVLI
jgi:hypothetical protein